MGIYLYALFKPIQTLYYVYPIPRRKMYYLYRISHVTPF